MGLFDSLSGFCDKLIEASDKQWERKIEEAERDYKNGRISFDQYSTIVNNYCEYTGKSASYWLNRAK